MMPLKTSENSITSVHIILAQESRKSMNYKLQVQWATAWQRNLLRQSFHFHTAFSLIVVWSTRVQRRQQMGQLDKHRVRIVSSPWGIELCGLVKLIFPLLLRYLIFLRVSKQRDARQAAHQFSRCAQACSKLEVGIFIFQLIPLN